MATNNFKPFATAANANVTAQADWESLPALLSGFTAGKASSAQVNKAIRQASFIAAALAQYTANKSGLDVLDDGDLNGFISKMGTAFGKDFQALDATLTALARLATGANKLPYFTGTDTASQTDLTSVGRDIIGKGTIADILTYLGLGEIATVADIQAGKASKLVGAEGLKKYLPTKVMQVSGFIRIPDVPGGTIIQWGQVTETINEGTKNVVLPTPFPNSARFAIAIPLNLAGDTSCDIFAQLQSASLTGINFFFSWVSSSTPANGFQWFAIGY